MEHSPKKPRAIDLYSGVGGWSFGLDLAGIDVVASYERWGAANETNFKNNRHQAHTVDIRRLALDELPHDIEIVVGSPPCTQFSYSNRGGTGDIEDGLTDIIKFLEIVDHLKPRMWAMENVPRVAKVMEIEARPGGRLERFGHLGMRSTIIHMEEFGVPQRRRRCIVGNFDPDLLMSYRSKCSSITLGEVVHALAQPAVVDPIFGASMAHDKITDHQIEDFLNAEEERINRANKVFHPVYNRMPFPDPLDRGVRTITATCTRVSRESIVIQDLTTPEKFRRLSVRERACLQGFPVGYQFYANSAGQKQKMVGNALPPAFAYFVAHAMLGTKSNDLQPLNAIGSTWQPPTPLAEEAKTDRAGSTFRDTRSFRFAIPRLRLASGVRFELYNDATSEGTRWRVRFVFGTSKSIQTIELDETLFHKLKGGLPQHLVETVGVVVDQLDECLQKADIGRMQAVWSHRGPGRTRPFMLLDELDGLGGRLVAAVAGDTTATQHLVEVALRNEFEPHVLLTIPGQAKLKANSALIFAGLLLGSRANAHFKTFDRATDGPVAVSR